MSGYTPGPWHVGPMSKTVRPEVTLPGTGGRNGGFIIADIHGADQADNARLISAAPELLASLIEMRDLFDTMCGLGFSPAESRDGSPKANADAAIAKATQVHA